MIVVAGVLFVAAIAGLAAVTEPAGPINGQELEKSFKKKITRTVSARYMVFLPKGIRPSQRTNLAPYYVFARLGRARR